MQATFAEGTVFAGRYRLLRRIATGGMGTVYEAVHLETDRRRAVKVMHPHLFRSDEMRERFKREARIAAQIESEHIVDVSDAGVDDATGVPFLVMELLRGEDLGARLKRVGRLPPHEAQLLLQQAAAALDRTHRSAVIHRDLKPENLFLTVREDGSPRLKVLDFGVAKIVAESATAAGATESLGTPLYMAPEQFRIGVGLTPAADIFALGMVTYTLLVGEPYWRPEAGLAGNAVAFALAAAYGPREAPSARAARVGVALPGGFDTWFARATAMDPAARFPSAGEAVRWLGAALGAEAGAAAATAPLPSFALSSAPGFAPGHASATPPFGAAQETLASVQVTNVLEPIAPSAGPGQASFAGAQSTGVLEAMTTTAKGAAAERFPAERRRGPVLVMAAVGLGVALLATGVWLGVRGAGSADSADASSRTAAAASAAGSSLVVTSSSAGAPDIPAPSSEPSAPATSTAVAATSASAASASAPTATASAASTPNARSPRPKASSASGRSTGAAGPPPVVPIFGRD